MGCADRMPSNNPPPSTKKIDLRRGFPEGLEMFDLLEDPRSSNATRHPFGGLTFIALSSIICGMDTCEDFARFAKARKDWLCKWIERNRPGDPLGLISSRPRIVS